VTDQVSFERVVREYGPAIDRLAWGYVDDAADHDDLVQDVLVALWRALPAFRGEASERTFVFRVAHNRAFTFALRRRRQAPLAADERTPDPRPGPEAQLDAAQRRDRLLAAIRRLGDAHRQAVMLHLEGFAVPEIAQLQGTSENNVAVRLTRARQRLRALMGEDE